VKPNPSQEYARRLEARRQTVQRYNQLDRAVARLRLAVFGLLLAIGWFALRERSLPLVWLLLPLLLFLILVVCHERVLRNWKRARRAVAFYEKGLARIEDRWAGTGAGWTGPEGDSARAAAPESHLYAADLDLFGKASLFELLCTARTRSGEETLANWLCSPSSRSEILARQEAVEELRNNIDLREDLAVLGEDVRAGIHPEIMIRWGTSQPVLDSPPARIIALVLSAFGAIALVDVVRFLLSGGTIWFALIVLAAEGAFALYYRSRVRKVIADVEEPEKELEILSLVLARLESERFSSAKLRGLRGALDTEGQPPSKQIARLARLIDWLNSRLNMIFLLVSNFLLWATQLSFAIEAWRQRSGRAVPRWLEAVGELEALCALAGYAYEHPNDPFPEIIENGPELDGADLRHPLLPAGQCVPNSLRLGSELRLMVVSGSNMSGKSTLLRTVGVNIVLALAGAPVRAGRMRLSPLALGATLRVQDSLQGGASRFYAEIQKLHHIMNLTRGPIPVLFLLDEILHGTNSHDRAVGAEAVIRGLINRGAVGLVTTHDLALARVAEALAPQAVNVHFEDRLENGRMTFDYRLRDGVVRKSNALELMRAVGLDV
jgi:hypothetical protein